MSDFRNIYKEDFKIIAVDEDDDKLMFIIEAIKPARTYALEKKTD
jgi:hypothetical protein